MRVFHHPFSVRHDPKLFFRRATLIPHPERAQRYLVMREAAASAGFELVEASAHGIEPILAVHDAGYVQFLRDIWSKRTELPGVEGEIMTGHFARPQMRRRPAGSLGLLGYYLADTSTPVLAGTWEAAFGSAQAAVGAADEALAAGKAYALCRPPGHHAYADSSGGFCYLNNTSVAAARMRERAGAPIAVLDVDVHHGNGTQGIFYARSDVVTASVHCDPADYFPFYAGYADEIGLGEGADCNRNFPLPHGSGDEPWLKAIEEAIDFLVQRKPAALVVALGLDAAQGDPLGAFKVTREGFSRAAELIAGVGLPTAVIQEGGYLCEALPYNLLAFLTRFAQ